MDLRLRSRLEDMYLYKRSFLWGFSKEAVDFCGCPERGLPYVHSHRDGELNFISKCGFFYIILILILIPISNSSLQSHGVLIQVEDLGCWVTICRVPGGK